MEFTRQEEKDYSRYCIERSRINDWIYRIGFELKQHKEFCAVTLTYDSEHLPANEELNLRDVQLFFKRLRKTLQPKTIRFFGCGEYGKKGHRPHYHEILFGYCPTDLVYSHTDDSGIKFYRSKQLADIWKNGFVIVCKDITPSTIPYLCKYLQKFNDFGEKDKKPFLHMSRRPGIGFCALSDPLLDFNNDKMYYRGRFRRVPRYYLKLLERVYFPKIDLLRPLHMDITVISAAYRLNRRSDTITPDCFRYLRDRRRLFYRDYINPNSYIADFHSRWLRGIKIFKKLMSKRLTI